MIVFSGNSAPFRTLTVLVLLQISTGCCIGPGLPLLLPGKWLSIQKKLSLLAALSWGLRYRYSCCGCAFESFESAVCGVVSSPVNSQRSPMYQSEGSCTRLRSVLIQKIVLSKAHGTSISSSCIGISRKVATHSNLVRPSVCLRMGFDPSIGWILLGGACFLGGAQGALLSMICCSPGFDSV